MRERNVCDIVSIPSRLQWLQLAVDEEHADRVPTHSAARQKMSVLIVQPMTSMTHEQLYVRQLGTSRCVDTSHCGANEHELSNTMSPTLWAASVDATAINELNVDDASAPTRQQGSTVRGVHLFTVTGALGSKDCETHDADETLCGKAVDCQIHR